MERWRAFFPNICYNNLRGCTEERKGISAEHTLIGLLCTGRLKGMAMDIKKLLKILLHRVVLIGLAIAVQIVLLVLMLVKFQEFFVFFYALCVVLSMVVVLIIVNGKSNPGYKIAWIIPVLLVPVFGGLFYLIFGGNRLSARTKRKMSIVEHRMRQALPPDNRVLKEMEKDNADAANQSRYIRDYAYSPVYKNTSCEYLPIGEAKFARMQEELKKAEHYIFLEYFIVQEGIMWDTIRDILVEKVRQGVEVRMIYDDMGCIMTLPYHYDKKLEALGIKCCVFNPFVPVVSSRFNNRDHRKICIIDGHTGFTGGINLADEYINTYEKHGHWKDSAVMIKGEAVWNLTVMFLSMWDYIKGIDEEYAPYEPSVHRKDMVESDGYVQPYSDNPLDDEIVGETVYFNLINKAKRYVYITTPYLIIDNEMVTALSTAAKSGVDVRIITPHIPDKWYVHAVTRAYYEGLLEAGIKIYEYTPGFIHAKNFVVDDEYATVGTINLDYRSLYLHFECGVWMYKTSSVAQVKADFLSTLDICQPITLESCRQVKWYRRIGRAVLRVLAPLM